MGFDFGFGLGFATLVFLPGVASPLASIRWLRAGSMRALKMHSIPAHSAPATAMPPTPTGASQQATGYELRFRALSDSAKDYSFPCDARGQVNLDALSERARNAYFFARVVIGHELAVPEVHCVEPALTA